MRHKIGMFMQEFEFHAIGCRAIRALLLFLALVIAAQSVAAEEIERGLVDIKSVAPSIVVDLRYAGTHNALHRALYPPSMPALTRPSVAKQLLAAQNLLRLYGYGLKIWDAYRPKSAQRQLWQFAHDQLYVANPDDGVGSLHTWGVAVDATLVDAFGRPVSMPTDFDDFTSAAVLHYHGTDPVIRSHLKLLQRAMGRNGFYGLRTEWWHFTTKDWKNYVRDQDVQVMGQPPKSGPDGKL
jgi:zinc D-Ala-D-Ala dipeptidase